ncbi:hypothetical protein [Streptomyces sp. NPDC058953]|uniref:hypothetical protein n=1 Tax=unclassified Streptomyces TaxID=2593676 RepID=UPI0036B73134
MSTPPPYPQSPQPEPGHESQGGYGHPGPGPYGDPYGQQQQPPQQQPPYQDPYAGQYPPQYPQQQYPQQGPPQGGGPPPQGYGTPQPPPAPYGYPQAPEQTQPIPPPPQAPYGGPPPQWGAPQPPPPPQKGRRTAGTIFIATGVVAGVLVLAWLGNTVFSGDDDKKSGSNDTSSSAGTSAGSGSGSGSGGGGSETDTDGFPKAEYKLTMPPTLVGGKYKFTDDLSELGEKAIEAEDPMIRNPKAIVAEYTATGGPQNGGVIVSGLYGQIKQPELARKGMLRGSASEKNSRLAVPPKDFQPAGADVTVSCQVIVATAGAVEVTTPVCAWADGNTGATVAVVDASAATIKPEAVDLAKAADTTAKIRQEMRKPVGP